MKQTRSTCVVHEYLEYVCCMFASSCKRGIIHAVYEKRKQRLTWVGRVDVSLSGEAVESVADEWRHIAADRTKTGQWSRHRLHLTLFKLLLLLTRHELRQTYVALLAVRLAELKRPPRHVPCSAVVHHYTNKNESDFVRDPLMNLQANRQVGWGFNSPKSRRLLGVMDPHLTHCVIVSRKL